MKPTLKQELPLIAIATLPFFYLIFIWNELPETIPLHWNLHGEVDRYGHKIELILLPLLLPVLTYSIFLIISKLDTKGKFKKMGGKFQTLKVLLVSLMTFIVLTIIHQINNQISFNTFYINIGVGTLFIILGNYFKTIPPNHFIGIRTPWTLKSENVWKTTHQTAGILWFSGGLLILVLTPMLNNQVSFLALIAISTIVSIIPMIHSYLLFKQNKELT